MADNDSTEVVEPSASFRATMSAVMAGERDAGTLERTAVENAAPTEPEETETPDPKETKQDPPKEAVETLDPEADPEKSESPKTEPEKDGEPDPEKQEGEPEKQTEDEPEKKADAKEDETPESISAARDALKAKEDDADDKDPLRGVHPSDPERFRKRVNNYEKLLTESQDELKKLRSEVDTLKKAEAQNGHLPEDVEQELKQYRRRYALEKDPEFQQKFGERIESSNSLVDEALKGINISDTLREQIRTMGGISEFIHSGVQVPIREGDKVKKVSATEFLNRALAVMDKNSPDDAAVVRSELANQRRINAEKEKFIKVETEEAKKYFDSLEQQSTQSKELRKKAEEALDTGIQKFRTDVFNLDWMKDQEAPDDASDDIKREVAAENKYRSRLRNFFDLQLKMPSVRAAAMGIKDQKELEEFGNMLVDATRVFHVEQERDRLKKQVKALEKEIAEVRNATKTTRKRTTGGKEASSMADDSPKREDFDSPMAHAIAYNRWAQANNKPLLS